VTIGQVSSKGPDQPGWQEKIMALREEYTRLQDTISMADVTRELGNVATEISGLPGKIAEIRQRGYAFAGYLEHKAEVLSGQWAEIRRQVEQTIRTEIERMQGEIDGIENLWRQLDAQTLDTARERVYNQVQGAMQRISGAVSAAQSRIEGLYGQVPDNVSQTQDQIRKIQEYMNLAEQSAVKWGPTEALFLAVEAEWAQSGKGKEDPDGILYLTDQRLIFEQKEKVGGRLGFGGQKVQQVLWDTPIGTITEAKAENQGFLGNKDMVFLKLSSGDYAELILEVKNADCKWYVQQLNRAISGEIAKERAIPVDQEAAEKVSSAPTACPTCGSTLPAVVRGMTEITCQYCGAVIRL
jgi:hypothetical protein